MEILEGFRTSISYKSWTQKVLTQQQQQQQPKKKKD